MIKPYALNFEKLNQDGLRILLKWARMEGWNPGPYDAEVYFATDPDGFYGYYQEGELIAGGSVVSYQKQFGFMGLFLVKPGFRLQGIGRELWYQRRNLLLSRLNKGAPIGMDGVLAMQSFYKKGGFEIAFKDERYEKYGEEYDSDKHISPINDADLETVLAYDKQCFGFSRPQFIKPWLKLPGTESFKYVEQNKLKGFAIIRKVQKGYKVCPLFADDDTVAEALYRACLNAVPGQALYMDIPVVNKAAVRLVKKYQAQYVFECARMYYGEPPLVENDKIFGITTFELG